MGTYYVAICKEKKECLEPIGSNKFPGICLENNEFCNVLVYLMCTRWSGYEVSIINDAVDCELFYSCLRNFKKIHRKSYKDWKHSTCDKDE